MTWYADEIIIPASDSVIAFLAKRSDLLPYCYHVTDLSGVKWYSEQHKHGLPIGGLIIIRPVRDTLGDDGQSWYQEPSLDWATLAAKDGQASSLSSGVTTALEQYLGEDYIPPLNFRAFLAELANQLSVPLIYYACTMWGGDIDTEYCLCYGPTESVLVTQSQLNSSTVGGDNSLCTGLGFLQFHLPSPFFALHVRSFPWPNYKLQNQT